MENHNRNGKLLTTAEVAEYLQVNMATLYKLIHEEGLPTIRVGRLYRIPETDLERWMEDRRYHNSTLRDDVAQAVKDALREIEGTQLKHQKLVTLAQRALEKLDAVGDLIDQNGKDQPFCADLRHELRGLLEGV